jgi:O-antigen/teichoic acid export membrane protein
MIIPAYLKLSVASYFNIMLQAIIFLFLAKFLNVELFGFYSFFLIIAQLLIIFIIGGLPVYYLTKKNKTECSRIENLFFQGINLSNDIYIFTISFFALIFFLGYITFNSFLAILILQTILPMISVEFINSILKKREEVNLLTFFILFINLIKIIVLISVFFFSFNFDHHSLAIYLTFFIFLSNYLISKLASSYQKKTFSKLSKFSLLKFFNEYFDHYKKSYDYSIYAIGAFIFYGIDGIYLKIFSNYSSVASYTIAFYFFWLFIIPVATFYQKIFTNKVLKYENKLDYKDHYLNPMKYLVFVGLLFIFAIYAFSETIFELIFNSKYRESYLIIKILALNIPLVYLSTHFGAFLNFKNKIVAKKNIIYTGIFINALLNMILIPKFLALGAVVATTISNIFLTILFYLESKKRFKF